MFVLYKKSAFIDVKIYLTLYRFVQSETADYCVLTMRARAVTWFSHARNRINCMNIVHMSVCHVGAQNKMQKHYLCNVM